MNEIADTRDERDEVLASLGDWFEMAQIDTFSGSDGDSSSYEQRMAKETLGSAKFNIDKLKNLEETIQHNTNVGRDISFLLKEKKQMQSQVLQQVREIKNINGLQFEKDKIKMSEVWSHASTVICDILQ